MIHALLLVTFSTLYAVEEIPLAANKALWHAYFNKPGTAVMLKYADQDVIVDLATGGQVPLPIVEGADRADQELDLRSLSSGVMVRPEKNLLVSRRLQEKDARTVDFKEKIQSVNMLTTWGRLAISTTKSFCILDIDKSGKVERDWGMHLNDGESATCLFDPSRKNVLVKWCAASKENSMIQELSLESTDEHRVFSAIASARIAVSPLIGSGQYLLQNGQSISLREFGSSAVLKSMNLPGCTNVFYTPDGTPWAIRNDGIANLLTEELLQGYRCERPDLLNCMQAERDRDVYHVKTFDETYTAREVNMPCQGYCPATGKILLESSKANGQPVLLLKKIEDFKCVREDFGYYRQ